MQQWLIHEKTNIDVQLKANIEHKMNCIIVNQIQILVYITQVLCIIDDN